MAVSTAYDIREDQAYVIHDKPDDSSPVSRLIKEGGDVLSIAELAGISIGQVGLLDRALLEYGPAFLKGLTSVSAIADSLRIDQVQATRLLAVLALGKRIYDPSQGALPILRDAQDVYVHTRSMANLSREHMKVLLLNSRYQLVHEEIIAIGSTDHLQVQPRDVYQAAVERRVPAILLVHNHPSDNPTPSAADREFTRRTQEAGRLLGIELLDHLVVTRTAYSSCLTQ